MLRWCIISSPQDHPSFGNEGVPPPPGKGIPNPEPPIDQDGDGGDTSSTTVGNFLHGASVFGEATATGMARHAHLAMYKVCEFDCSEGYVLAAMDVVVDDGVDVLSFSRGCPTIPFYKDVIASCIWSNSKGSFCQLCSWKLRS
ncbi:subtilisin-like protease SDD1 [Pyrus ussuriensis x Pyrus communis]|uniref:Subtilisin-like protease SDD1 n=1 Tax=Pyrus ussuriensis x Pyrus communis TaxID=2448454 RepID=A0A5N5H7V9_9ROSA|nr:subtilisin-like protease SDD1 [Pyrus ussuriensis x Pyrus communis]